MTHVEVNDGTVEGVRHRDYPAAISPRCGPGPHDGLHLFDEFMELMDAWKGKTNAKTNGHQEIMVIGSGPIIIGQAAEFDYAGTQACLALKKKGMKLS